MTTVVYGGGPFYPGKDSALPALKHQGFSTVVCWTLHVSEEGDLHYNGKELVKSGEYVGDPSWANELANLKEGGDVKKVLFSVGSGEVQDFTHVQSLIQKHGTTKGPLFENFSKLLETIPAIDGIDFDDEDNYSQSTIVSFAEMLAGIGYGEITFCPYEQPDFWANCLKALEESHPGLVTAFHLQCYSGGGWNLNHVQSWIDQVKAALPSGSDAAAFVVPGLQCIYQPYGSKTCNAGMNPDQFAKQFDTYSKEGIKGGFLWLYDQLLTCQQDPQKYAEAIRTGLGAGKLPT